MHTQVAQLWDSEARLAQVGQAAAWKARSWTESANAAALLSLVEQSLVPVSVMVHPSL